LLDKSLLDPVLKSVTPRWPRSTTWTGRPSTATCWSWRRRHRATRHAA